MEKEFIPYELAVKLKTLGFDEPCLASWSYTYELQNYVELNLGYIIDGPKNYTNAPIYSQAFRWFRDNYRMFHEVFIDTEPTVDEPDKLEFTYLILHMVGMEKMHTSRNVRFETYEEAELASLEKLIEIVEQKEIR